MSYDIIDTFNEQLTYDKNGNIKTLVRNGGMESQTTVPVMDNLVYGYDANEKNKLIKVTDATANTDGFKDGANNREEYGYDPNGNMTRDDNKGISSMVYNHLNLPTRIVIQNGGDFPSISYLYTATGKKVAKTVNSASRHSILYTVDYLDGFQYESGQLLFFPTAEGYVKYTFGATNPFDYVFNYTDHLGNIRLSYGINPTTALLTKIEENNYYPFGLKHATYNTTAKVIAKIQNPEEVAAINEKLMIQKIDLLAAEMDLPPMEITLGEFIPEIYSGYNYKYNGKELQDELGLNVYDYGARMYDPAIGRWPCIDPLAEQTPEWSPYAFCNNNPIRYNDPTGMSTESPNDDYRLLKSGKVELIKKTDDNFDRVYNEDKSKNFEVKKGLVGQLENKRAGSEKNAEGGYYSSIGDQSTQHSKDYKSLFKFVSDNSNAEFSLTSFTHKGKDLIQLSTFRNSDASPSPFQLGIDNPNQNVSDHMHSHPGIRTLPEVENYSMGGDYQHSKTDNRQYPNNVYFPNSSRLYRVTIQGTQLIKKIKSSKDF